MNLASLRIFLKEVFFGKYFVLSLFSLSFSLSLLGGEWVEHSPGGDTLCAKGDEFSFFVYEGDPKKVVVDYIGGGACWDADTCAKGTFIENLDMIREFYANGMTGFYNHDNEENPIKDWTHIVVPYCTGDIHWGENDKVYEKENGETFTIHHRGAINAKAVHSWMKENIESPETLFVTGCSAGAYGSVYWTPHLKRLYPDSLVTQFGDSGTGIVTQDFLENSLINWRPDKNAPRWIPGLDPRRVDWRELTLIDYYLRVGAFYPDVPLSQFSYDLDENQLFFHELMGGDSSDWHIRMENSFEILRTNLSNFNTFVASGDSHCILPYETIYTQKNPEGEFFKNWFKQRLEGN